MPTLDDVLTAARAAGFTHVRRDGADGKLLDLGALDEDFTMVVLRGFVHEHDVDQQYWHYLPPHDPRPHESGCPYIMFSIPWASPAIVWRLERDPADGGTATDRDVAAGAAATSQPQRRSTGPLGARAASGENHERPHGTA